MSKIVEHVKKHKVIYASVGTGVVVAGITYLVMRSRLDSSISRGIPVTAKRGPAVPGEASVNALEANRGGLVLGNSYALNNVSFISSNRQGPPSWVIRCLEDDTVETSQQAMALAKDISPSELSKHLNGLLDNVRGLHFERVCMAA